MLEDCRQESNSQSDTSVGDRRDVPNHKPVDEKTTENELHCPDELANTLLGNVETTAHERGCWIRFLIGSTARHVSARSR